MLFDPAFLLREPGLVLATLAIVLVGKPLAALAVVAALGYSSRTALTVALGLAQIGEFSFILAELGRQHGLLPRGWLQRRSVACALVSITLNPVLFRRLDDIESWLRGRPVLWRLLNARADRRRDAVNAEAPTRGRGARRPGRDRGVRARRPQRRPPPRAVRACRRSSST